MKLLGHTCIIAIGQVRDELVGVVQLSSPVHLLISGIISDIFQIKIKSQLFIKPFLHQLISQSAVQKPSLRAEI